MCTLLCIIVFCLTQRTVVNVYIFYDIRVDEIPQVSCQELNFQPVYLRNEAEYVETMLQICSFVVGRLSMYGSPYANGYNSIMECVRQQHWTMEHFLSKRVLGRNTLVNSLLFPLADLPPSPGCEVNWMWYLGAFENSGSDGSDNDHFSQAGQDGVLDAILDMIGITAEPFYVEVGYNAPHLTSGSNTLHLHERGGWRGLLIDGEHQNKSINLHAHFVTHDNIESIFDQHKVPLEPDYVSIDIDSIDVWVARSLLKSKYR